MRTRRTREAVGEDAGGRSVLGEGVALSTEFELFRELTGVVRGKEGEAEGRGASLERVGLVRKGENRQASGARLSQSKVTRYERLRDAKEEYNSKNTRKTTAKPGWRGLRGLRGRSVRGGKEGVSTHVRRGRKKQDEPSVDLPGRPQSPNRPPSRPPPPQKARQRATTTHASS